jgi:hypothetical protein|tara:strand:+ start:932 stop:1303 length:372 start_codon:yes stop_codon:yes gene_type:complete
MRHDFTPPEPSPLTPEQMAATLGLLDDVDTQCVRFGLFNKELQPYWESVKCCIQELVDGTIDKNDLQSAHPFTIWQSCQEEDWDSAVNFKECFAYQIGQMAGIITDITGDIKDGWEAQLDKED